MGVWNSRGGGLKKYKKLIVGEEGWKSREGWKKLKILITGGRVGF